MRSRVLERAQGLAALVAVVATLALPPVALVRFVGNPLPSGAPSPSEIVDGLTRGGISDRTVIDVLAVLAWIIWTQLAVALVAEIVALARGRQATSLPVLPGLQPLAARWLAAVALLIAPLVPGPSVAATAPAPIAVPVTDRVPAAQVLDDPRASSQDPVVPTAGAVAPEQRLVEYVVQRHDSFWDIAERCIGDPFRWREIRDLNVGRPQPGGEAVEAGSDLIRPGWRLLVPAVALSTAPAPAPQPAGERTIARGDHLWEVAEETVTTHLGRPASDDEIRPYWQSLVDENRDALADPANPNLVFAGQIVRLPPLPGSAAPAPRAEAADELPPEGQSAPQPNDASSAPPEGSPETVPTSAPPTTVEATSRLPSADLEATSADDEAGTTVPLAGLLGVAGTGIAVGLTAAVRTRRRQRLARAPAGFAPPPLPEELTELRTGLALAADLDTDDDLHRAMATIAGHVATARTLGRRRVRLVQVSPDRIEVLLDEPALPAPPGWEPEASGAVWSCSRPVPPGIGCTASPTLVTIGSEEGNDVLLELESAGLVTIGGDDPASTFGLVRSLVLELAHARHAPAVSVVVVGDIEHVESDRVRRVERWEDVADDALAWARQSRQVLAAHRLPTAFAARGTGRSLDGVAPLVVVCDGPPHGGTFDEFCALAREGGAVCAVAISPEPMPGSTHIRIDGATLSLGDLDLVCRAQGIGAPIVEQVSDLVAAAECPPERIAIVDDDVIQLEPSPDPYEDPRWDILVRVLGEIRVIGGHKPLTPKQTGMFTFVALHDPCSADRIEEAIWPGPMGSRRQQVHNQASRIRAAIGAEHLPASAGSEYCVGPRVRTDLDLLRRRATYAAAQPPEQAINTLRGALELVEGPAFTYRSADRGAFTWVDTEHWTSDTEARIVEISWRMWNLCTELGDTDGAIWAARQGLLASPGNTELTDALMRAYLASGDRAAAQDVFMSHAKALDELEQDDPAPSTLQLWEDMQEGREPSRS